MNPVLKLIGCSLLAGFASCFTLIHNRPQGLLNPVGLLTNCRGYIPRKVAKQGLSLSETSSSYEKSSGLVKTIVGGLTDFTNTIFGGSSKVIPIRSYKTEKLNPYELLLRIRDDFRRGYLFSGDIDPEIYDEECLFTDPTLSFKGLTVFERNIESLKPLLSYFLTDRIVVLYKSDLFRDEGKVRTQWRMSGDINLPWRPRIELTGRTQFSYDESKNGRVVSYYENWDIPAADALRQLISPLKKGSYRIPKGSRSILVEDIRSTLTEVLDKSVASIESKRAKLVEVLDELCLSTTMGRINSFGVSIGPYGSTWKICYLPSLSSLEKNVLIRPISFLINAIGYINPISKTEDTLATSMNLGGLVVRGEFVIISQDDETLAFQIEDIRAPNILSNFFLTRATSDTSGQVTTRFKLLYADDVCKIFRTVNDDFIYCALEQKLK